MKPVSIAERTPAAPKRWPAAFLLTFTTYGTHLPGDLRGSHDRRGPRDTRPIAPNPVLVAQARSHMKKPPFSLGGREREVVDATIAAICIDRDWPLHAWNVRTEHAHIVLTAAMFPDEVASVLKVACTTALVRTGLIEEGRKVWTKGQSTRWIFGEKWVPAAVEYVNDRQGAPLTRRLRQHAALEGRVD